MNNVTQELERLINETIRLQEECRVLIDEAKQLLISSIAIVTTLRLRSEKLGEYKPVGLMPSNGKGFLYTINKTLR